MLAKGVNFQVFNTGAYHQIPDITSFALSGTTWASEDTTNHDSTTPVKTEQTTIRDEGKITLVVSPWVPGNSYHSYLFALSQSGAANNFKVTYPNSQIGSFEFSGFVSAFAFDTPVNGLLKGKLTITVNGALTDDVATLQTVTFTDAFAGVYHTGNVMEMSATFDEIVNVTGTPRIPIVLTSGTVYATYAAGTGTNVLVFRHTTGGGDAATAGNMSVTSPVGLNGGTVLDNTDAQAAVLTFTPPTTSAFTVN